MKYIDKTATQPAKLVAWKTYHHTALQTLYSNTGKTGVEIWKYLDNHKELNTSSTDSYSKNELKETLINEQGAICCYCGKRIENDHRSVLEHLNPKSIYKDSTYDYTNLLASCDGGKTYKIHHVKTGETLTSIANDYGVSEEYLIEIYVDVPKSKHIELLTKLYDIENLKAGDRLFIIPYLDAAYHHCDTKKKNQEISLQPTQPNIETHFKYLIDGKIDTTISPAVEDTVNKLGLNLPPLLVAERKKLVGQAKKLRKAVLDKYGTALFRSAIKQLCEKYYAGDAQGVLDSHVFVLVSVLGE